MEDIDRRLQLSQKLARIDAVTFRVVLRESEIGQISNGGTVVLVLHGYGRLMLYGVKDPSASQPKVCILLELEAPLAAP